MNATELLANTLSPGTSIFFQPRHPAADGASYLATYPHIHIPSRLQMDIRVMMPPKSSRAHLGRTT